MDTKKDIPLNEIDDLQEATKDQTTLTRFRIGAIAGSIAATVGLVLAHQNNLVNNQHALVVSAVGVVGNLVISYGIRLKGNALVADIARLENEIMHKTREQDILLVSAELEARGVRIQGLQPAEEGDNNYAALRRCIVDVVTSALHLLTNLLP